MVPAVGSIMTRSKAPPMMNDHRGEGVEVGGGGVVAVGGEVEEMGECYSHHYLASAAFAAPPGDGDGGNREGVVSFV